MLDERQGGKGCASGDGDHAQRDCRPTLCDPKRKWEDREDREGGSVLTLRMIKVGAVLGDCTTHVAERVGEPWYARRPEQAEL